MLVKLIQFILRAYHVVVSPWLGNRCRFSPTCSDYAQQALEKHGAFKGSFLTIKRIGRCHPWGGSGHDPVPESVAVSCCQRDQPHKELINTHNPDQNQRK